MLLTLSVVVALLFYAALAFFISPFFAAAWMVVGFFLTTRAAKVGILGLEGQIFLSITAPVILVKVVVKRIRAIQIARRIRKALSRGPS